MDERFGVLLAVFLVLALDTLDWTFSRTEVTNHREPNPNKSPSDGTERGRPVAVTRASECDLGRGGVSPGVYAVV